MSAADAAIYLSKKIKETENEINELEKKLLDPTLTPEEIEIIEKKDWEKINGIWM